MTVVARVGTLIALAMLVTTLSPPDQAWACSCAEPTIEQVLGYEPDAAVARVERTDRDGGSSGTGRVEEVLHGPALPAELPLALDDGASCLPWLAVGDVAVLTFVPDGDGWRTMECGKLDPATGLDPVTPDPAASPPAAVILTGSFPGADVVALDDHLRVLAAASPPDGVHGLMACGEGLLGETFTSSGEQVLVLLGLPNLEVVGQRSSRAAADAEVQIVDARCEGGRVDVLSVAWGGSPRVRLDLDVFGDARLLELPAATDAAFAGDEVLLLRETGANEELRLESHDMASGGRVVFELAGARGYELTVSPGSGHVLVRGHADEPLLVVVDLATGEEVARSTGWWQPVRRPWLGAERILQIDEDSGGVGGTGLAGYRVVDLGLAEVATIDATHGWNAAAGEGAVLSRAGRSIVVAGADGTAIRSAEYPWVAGASELVPLGTVVPEPSPAPSEPLATPSDVVPAAAGPTGGVAQPEDQAPRPVSPWVIGVAVLTLAALALTVASYRRRRPSS